MYQFHGIDLTISSLCQASQAHIQFKHTRVLHILCAHVNILLFWYRIVNPESWITKEMVTLKQWYINDTPKLVYLTPKVTTALFMIVKMKRVEDPPQHPRRNGCKGDVSQVLPCTEFLGGKNAPERQARYVNAQCTYYTISSYLAARRKKLSYSTCSRSNIDGSNASPWASLKASQWSET